MSGLFYEQKMNLSRPQRRAMARAKRIVARGTIDRRDLADPLAGLRVLDNARPFDQGDNTESHIKTRAAFERLRDAGADNDDFPTEIAVVRIDDAAGRANAKLIAEAPEMLKALRSIAAITTCADQDPEAMCAEIQGICRVALAKVTGDTA